MESIKKATFSTLLERVMGDKAESDLAEIVATLMVNFGPGERGYSGILTGTESPLGMLIMAFDGVIKQEAEKLKEALDFIEQVANESTCPGNCKFDLLNFKAIQFLQKISDEKNT